MRKSRTWKFLETRRLHTRRSKWCIQPYVACTKINFQRKLHLLVEIACISGILSLHALYSNGKKPPIIQIPECNKRSESRLQRAFNKFIMLCGKALCFSGTELLKVLAYGSLADFKWQNYWGKPIRHNHFTHRDRLRNYNIILNWHKTIAWCNLNNCLPGVYRKCITASRLFTIQTVWYTRTTNRQQG